ncbi:MAG: hypothetical protein EOM24_04995, partial [Chloroflexia bacterium]|nr:hypothetical protein [Chloroflexia bacterium]
MRTHRSPLISVLIILFMLFVSVGSGFRAQAQIVDQELVDPAISAEVETASELAVSETGLYIVRFAEPALASYTGGLLNLPATSPEATGARRLDVTTAASQAYLQYLNTKQNQFEVALDQMLQRPVEVAFNYVGVLNAIAVRVSHDEAQRIAARPEVVAVYADTIRELVTDVGPGLIGAPAIWNGETSAQVATRGEGIVIGVIDSGINPQHPSFAATDGDGYAHTNPYGAGVYRGWCATNPAFCNSKLIGAYNFHPNGGSPEDTDGHGSHTASTAGGNAHIATFDVGSDTYNLPIQGVAPRANIVAYKVCDPACPSTSSIQAVDSAILNDQVDVLNYSISGSDDPWNDPVDLAFLDASNAGIFVSASAGNQGPGPSTVAKTGPWNAAVAASTHNRAIVQTLDVTAPTSPPDLQALPVVPGEGTVIATNITGGLRYDETNNLGCEAFAAGTFTGNLALIQRGSCTFETKATNAVNAGATGVVLFNNVGGPPITAGGLTGTPPFVMLDLASGTALRDYVLANPTTTQVRINAATSLIYQDAWQHIVAGFSSRGPSQFELIKPDYTAPGVNILAAVAADAGDPVQYGFLQGTSMSSPHGAGSAALMMALHPSWSPAEIRSAMATTAVNDLRKEDGLTPADAFDVGAGRLDLARASTVGLVLDESGANYLAADPLTGGDPKALNQPGLVNYNCAEQCTWTRTVKSVLTQPVTYTASFAGPGGMSATVTPTTFTINPGATQVLTMTADVSGLPPGEFAFGRITLQTRATHPAPLLNPSSTTCPAWPEIGELTATTPVFNRPVGSGVSCNLSGVGTAAHYEVYSYNLGGPEPHHLLASTVGGATMDTVLVFYQASDGSANPFDPTQPCLNTVAYNDDAAGGLQSQLEVSNLLAGQVDVVLTTFENNVTGSYTMQVESNTCQDSGVRRVAATNLPVVVLPIAATPAITVTP